MVLIKKKQMTLIDGTANTVVNLSTAFSAVQGNGMKDVCILHCMHPTRAEEMAFRVHKSFEESFLSPLLTFMSSLYEY